MTGLTCAFAALGEISTSGGAADVAGLKTACIDLAVSVSAAQSYGPIPEPGVQGHWATALDRFSSAAVECSAGLTTFNTAMITQAANDETAGTAELDEANKELLAL